MGYGEIVSLCGHWGWGTGDRSALMDGDDIMGEVRIGGTSGILRLPRQAIGPGAIDSREPP